MIAGGYVNRGPFNITEVVELLKSNSTPSFGQLPSIYQGNAVGSMLGNVPIICGGYNAYLTTTNIQNGSSTVDFCISFENSEWSQTHLLNDKRAFSAGVKINSTTIWIVGGSTSTSISDLLDSTEFIVQGKSNGVPGRDGRASKSSGIERARASDVRAHSSSSKLEHQMIEHIRVRASIEHQILKKILVFWSLE